MSFELPTRKITRIVSGGKLSILFLFLNLLLIRMSLAHSMVNQSYFDLRFCDFDKTWGSKSHERDLEI